jgi:hypothetical protein
MSVTVQSVSGSLTSGSHLTPRKYERCILGEVNILAVADAGEIQHRVVVVPR